jgi:AraC-like DNA-binding protein
LQAGGSGAMITMQDGEFTPVPFNDVIDHNTGRGRQRAVDITTESYQVARDYMVRINAKDFGDAGWVEELAKAAGLSPSDFRARFAKLGQQ